MNSAKLPVNLLKNSLLLDTNRYKLYYNEIIYQDLILKQNYNTILEIPSFKIFSIISRDKLPRVFS